MCHLLNLVQNFLIPLFWNHTFFWIALSTFSCKQFFKDIFISEKLGFVKPQKEFFDEVFSKIQNFDKQSAIIVGDSLSSDIKGGNNAEIKTCWFNPKHLQNQTDAKVDYEIHSLNEIYKIL